LPLHRKGAQAVVPVDVQMALALQSCALVNVVPEHEAAVQLPSGSVLVLTLEHVPLTPTLSAAEQAWHVPLHAVLQQKPSTQLPLLHWLPVPVQAELCAFFGVHVVPAQYAVETQSASIAQVAVQALPLHRKGAQAVVPVDVQMALALQSCALVNVVPEHEAAAQLLSGSVSVLTLEHVPLAPTLSAAEQAWHVPAHAVSQQKLSTQLPLLHVLPPAHAVPFTAFTTQFDIMQYADAAHCASELQLVGQALPAQR